MDLLTELAFVLKQHQANIADQVLPKKSKLKRLYVAVAAGKVTNDEEAAQLIYRSTPKDKKFLMLKKNLISRLVELVLEIDTNKSYQNNYLHIEFMCNQKLAITEKLLQQNVYHNAEKIINKVQSQAEKYHLISVQLRAARQLRTIYALKGFPNETIAFDRMVGILSIHEDFESRANGFWQIMQSKVKFFISYMPPHIEDAKKYAKQIATWLQRFPSPFMQMYFLRIQIVWQLQSGALEEWRQSIEQLEQLPKDYPFLRTVSLDLETNLEWVRYYRATDELTLAHFYLDRCLNLSDYQAFNKFEVVGYAFDLYLKQEKYEEAGIFLREVYRTKQFENLDPIDISIWGIRSLYLQFIFKILGKGGKIKKYVKHFENQKAISNFLHVRQPVSKDKRGYNLHLVILRLLFQTLYSNEDSASEGNKMMVYFQRHLKPLENHRTGIFYKSLARIAASGYEERYTQKRSTLFYERMPNAHNGQQYDQCELIPYERFWEWILNIVTKNTSTALAGK